MLARSLVHASLGVSISLIYMIYVSIVVNGFTARFQLTSEIPVQ